MRRKNPGKRALRAEKFSTGMRKMIDGQGMSGCQYSLQVAEINILKLIRDLDVPTVHVH